MTSSLHFTINNSQCSMSNEKLLKIENCKMKIASEGTA